MIYCCTFINLSFSAFNLQHFLQAVSSGNIRFNNAFFACLDALINNNLVLDRGCERPGYTRGDNSGATEPFFHCHSDAIMTLLLPITLLFKSCLLNCMQGRIR